MLRELTVQNLALIEDARIVLHPGYCAWTGETGAGKSLLLTAIGLILGGKASSELIRGGKDEARASAVFEVGDPRLKRDIETILGGALDDDQLILTRRISAPGRSACHANGMPVAVATLKALGDRLIDIHGQHESRALLDPDRQRLLLDEFGAVGPLLSEYRRYRDEHARLLAHRESLINDSHQRERERTLLEYERDELLAGEPILGEFDDLNGEAHRLANAESVRSCSLEGYALLYESEPSAQGLLELVARRLAPLSGSIPEFADASADLLRLADEAREVAYSLRKLAKDWSEDPTRLEEVEGRLATYRRLASRFRCGPDELAGRLANIQDKLETIDTAHADLRSLDGPISRAWDGTRNAGIALSIGRKKSCQAFTKAIRSQLKGLGLDQATLSIDVTTNSVPEDPFESSAPSNGFDSAELMFAPNPGEAPRPLRKIASGGETSRVMLAIKATLSAADPVPTLIFDEIDTGVGGRLGASLGRKLAEIAKHHQVICVTHLPQMASFATHQWIVRKKTDRGKTRTTITPLDEEQRVDEIAAMLRGDSAAEGTRQEALSMLLEARNLH